MPRPRIAGANIFCNSLGTTALVSSLERSTSHTRAWDQWSITGASRIRLRKALRRHIRHSDSSDARTRRTQELPNTTALAPRVASIYDTMAPGRSLKALVSRRRRTEGDEEDDESVTVADESQSEGSVASDLDQDVDADHSDMSDTDTTEPMVTDSAPTAPNGTADKAQARSKRTRKSKKGKEQAPSQTNPPAFETSTDTQAMLNGFKTAETTQPVVDFEDTVANEPSKPTDTSTESYPSSRRPDTVADRRKKEHEEYKKKRDSDPTFIPNRGNFFMHDPRTPDQRGFSSHGSSRGRGRGRGGFVGGPFAPVAYVLPRSRSASIQLADTSFSQVPQVEKTADAPWAHDLHDTLNESNSITNARSMRLGQSQAPAGPASAKARGGMAASSRPLNFSKTTQIGNVQIRVNLPGMKAAIPFSAVPVKSHTRLPDHRPPLRRDKPVRVSLPDHPARYVFPSSERSFIFIPRAMRPNQQGFGRMRGSFSAYGGPASRRTSAYGGSVYSPSVTMSRRSSLAREIPRDSAFSPTGSYTSRPHPQPGRPVVRLPQGGRSSNASPAGSAYGRNQPYPLPQKPAVEHWADPGTMHQPRPQKTISVTGIESPAGMSLHAPQQQDQQPFHNQLPQHMADPNAIAQPGPSETAPPPYYGHQPYMHQGGATTGTPLSNIPERAIHAQPFQPPVPPYYPQYPNTGYYYPGQSPQYSAMPVFVSSVQPQTGYPGPETEGPPASADLGTVAHESNGMVYYMDAGQYPQYPPQQDNYLQPPPSYAVPGMGGMLTPSPEGGYYYPQVPTGPVYYPQAQ